MQAYYANRDMKMLSPFIDSSIDNVLLQTNPGFTSRFLTSQTFLNIIWQRHCCMTVKPCNKLTVGAQRSGQMKFIDVFSFISTRIMLCLLSQSSVETDVGCGGNLNNDLIAICVRNTGCAKKWPNLFFGRTLSNLHQIC